MAGETSVLLNLPVTVFTESEGRELLEEAPNVAAGEANRCPESRSTVNRRDTGPASGVAPRLHRNQLAVGVLQSGESTARMFEGHPWPWPSLS